MLKLMYITNNIDVALIAEKNGVDRIFVDMEYIDKDKRQANMNTVQNSHTIEDIKNLRRVLTKSKLLVRVNPIHNATNEYCSSEEEIASVIDAGADIIMLPYFKTIEEVERFLSIVNKRVKTILLFETLESINDLDDILNINNIDEVYIGLNDLSLGYGKKFLFELLADGTVDKLVTKFKEKNLPFGFGGIASVNRGYVHGHIIIKEHFRLDSSLAILSRSFCNINDYIKEKPHLNRNDLVEIDNVFKYRLKEIYDLENYCEKIVKSQETIFFEENRKKFIDKVNEVVKNMDKINGI